MKSKFFQKFAFAPSIGIISLILALCYVQPVCVSKNTSLIKKIKVLTPSGKPFFPLGFYHVSNRLTAQQRMVALQDTAAAGFNVIHAGCSNLDDYSKFLDEANRLGVYVITEFDYTNYAQIVQKFKDKPAVLGWNIGDDAGDHKTKVEILDLEQKIKEIDPSHYTSISISGWSRKWAEFADAADLIGGQSYPIGYTLSNKIQGLPNTLIEVNHSFKLATTETSRRNRPFIANIQAFRWDNQRSPTANEVYNMTYQSLLAGVKGILFFAYSDGGKNQIRDNPPVWNRLKSIVPEIDQLSPILLDGTLTNLDTKNKELLAGQWEYKNHFYVIIVNTSQTKKIAASIKTSAHKSFAKTFFPGRPSGMKLRNRYLSGSVNPEDVHIYQIDR
jgi:hypothetical protein